MAGICADSPIMNGMLSALKGVKNFVVEAKVSGPLSEAEDGLYTFGRIGEELTKRLNLGTALLGHLPNQGSRLW